MEIIANRNEQLKMVAEATVYFKALGLSYNFEAFFTSDPVKRTLHEIYEVFTSDAKKIVSNLPGPAQKRGKQIFVSIPGEEATYVEDVKNSFLCTVMHLLQSLNCFILVDDAIINKFNQAFAHDSEDKMLKVLSEVANGLAEILLEEFQAAVSLPPGIPDEVANVLLTISGGKPMVTMQEIEDFRRENPSDDGESKERKPNIRLHHPKKYP